MLEALQNTLIMVGVFTFFLSLFYTVAFVARFLYCMINKRELDPTNKELTTLLFSLTYISTYLVYLIKF